MGGRQVFVPRTLNGKELPFDLEAARHRIWSLCSDHEGSCATLMEDNHIDSLRHLQKSHGEFETF